jgi:negative regulator of sigma E activity
VAGYDCQVVVLEAKDRLRYGHQFCAEARSGLPLRARTFSEKKRQLESFAFTEVKIGGRFSRDQVRSSYAAKSKEWKVDHSALVLKDVPADTGWTLTRQPAGFKKLTEMKRSIAGRGNVVSHIVYSDGLAAISVFIEPLPKTRPARSLSQRSRQHLRPPGRGPHGDRAGRDSRRDGDADCKFARIHEGTRQITFLAFPPRPVPHRF